MTRSDGDLARTLRLRHQLLEWYARNKRDLPWRRSSDPYAIWVSEIMLQQTRVAVVVERYTAFLSRFPTVSSLAQAGEQDVLALWSGLGYYRRARMLHKAAQHVVNELEGRLPTDSEGLRGLPGIGAYTAAAIASIAHGEPVAVVDGNVERVLCRLQGWGHGSGGHAISLRQRIGTLAQKLVDPAQPGNFNQAMMELGATVCLPRNPQCVVCPLSAECHTKGEHTAAPRQPMQNRISACALAVRDASEGHEEEVLLEQRAESHTVMPGLWELPVLKTAEIPSEDLRMTVRHAIMQVNYAVRVRTVREDDVDALTVKAGDRRWVLLSEAGSMALTGLARKVLKRAHLLEASRNSTTDAVAPEARATVV
jgi:A/G-specific adenine glycosylase